MTTALSAERQDKYTATKTSVGGITCITMHGTLNEAFEGRKLALSMRTKKILINMRDVRRFASWGMSEWMDFLRVTADYDVYLVECSSYAVSQLNLVTGLLGHAKLVSFYSSYRCTSCNEEIQWLFLLPRDRNAIRDMRGSTQTCPSCGGMARLEEYPAAFFDAIGARPPFDIDDEALAYMRSQLKYDLQPDLTRFRAVRRQQKEYTYLRLSGNMATLSSDTLVRASEGTTVIDLEGAVFEPGTLTGWRNYVPAAMARVKSLQLLNCPWGFLESAVRPDDLRDKLKVRSFAQPFECGTCGSRTMQLIDVAELLEELVQGVIPGRCPSCRSSLAVRTIGELDAVVRALPARDRDVALDAFITRMREVPSDQLENCLIAAPTKLPPAPPSPNRGIYAAIGLGVVVLGVGVVAATRYLGPRENSKTTVGPQTTPQPRPAFSRPDWIMSDVPASAYCHDMINRLMCVGVSSYRPNKDDGVSEATDAALEELVSSVGLKVTDAFVKDTIINSYGEVRTKTLSALQAADLDRATDPHAASAFAAADEAVRKARRRVVEVLQSSGGAAVPAQRSDWYWEEYARETGKGTEFLVFVRFDVSLEQQRALVEKYSSSSTVLGSTVVTAFPALAWLHPGFTGGAFVEKVGGAFAAAGIPGQSIVTAVGEKRIADAPQLAHQVEDAAKGAELKLTVQVGDSAGQTVAIKK